MDFIDHIDLKQVGKIVVVEKVFFRDSFYNNFHKLFLDGYIDTTILPPAPNSNVKIRYSTYRPREELLKHLDKLRAYYDVQMFPGFMNFETGKIYHTMPENYDYVRLVPDEKVEYNNGFQGTHPINVIGVLIDEDDITDEDFDTKKLDKKIEDILLKARKSKDYDIKTIE